MEQRLTLGTRKDVGRAELVRGAFGGGIKEDRALTSTHGRQNGVQVSSSGAAMSHSV